MRCRESAPAAWSRGMVTCTLLLAWALPIPLLHGYSCLQGHIMNGAGELSDEMGHSEPAHCLSLGAVALLRLEVNCSALYCQQKKCTWRQGFGGLVWVQHCIIGVYVTFERAQGSFSRLWSPLQLVALDCVCSCVTDTNSISVPLSGRWKCGEGLGETRRIHMSKQSPLQWAFLVRRITWE